MAQAPVLDVRRAAAEFISNDTTAGFVVRAITVSGHVDTMKATIHTSSARSVSEEYSRYKPICDSVTWNDSGEVFVFLHLDGKLPLPEDSVRGAVRLSVAASHWNGEEWQGTVSEKFSVAIANVEVPKPLISPLPTNPKTAPIRWEENEVWLGDFVVRLRDPDSVDKMDDVREIVLDSVAVQVVNGQIRIESTDQLVPISVRLVAEPRNRYKLIGKIDAAVPKKFQSQVVGSVKMILKARSRHRNVQSKWRTLTTEVKVQ